MEVWTKALGLSTPGPKDGYRLKLHKPLEQWSVQLKYPRDACSQA